MPKSPLRVNAVAEERAAMSVDELAIYLRISPASAWRLLKAGKLARVKIGHRTVVRRIDADDFLARCAQASAA